MSILHLHIPVGCMTSKSAALVFSRDFCVWEELSAVKTPFCFSHLSIDNYVIWWLHMQNISACLPCTNNVLPSFSCFFPQLVPLVHVKTIMYLTVLTLSFFSSVMLFVQHAVQLAWPLSCTWKTNLPCILHFCCFATCWKVDRMLCSFSIKYWLILQVNFWRLHLWISGTVDWIHKGYYVQVICKCYLIIALLWKTRWRCSHLDICYHEFPSFAILSNINVNWMWHLHWHLQKFWWYHGGQKEDAFVVREAKLQ